MNHYAKRGGAAAIEKGIDRMNRIHRMWKADEKWYGALPHEPTKAAAA